MTCPPTHLDPNLEDAQQLHFVVRHDLLDGHQQGGQHSVEAAEFPVQQLAGLLLLPAGTRVHDVDATEHRTAHGKVDDQDELEELLGAIHGLHQPGQE